MEPSQYRARIRDHLRKYQPKIVTELGASEFQALVQELATETALAVEVTFHRLEAAKQPPADVKADLRRMAAYRRMTHLQAEELVLAEVLVPDPETEKAMRAGGYD